MASNDSDSSCMLEALSMEDNSVKERLQSYLECAEYVVQKCRGLAHIKGAGKLERKCLAELKYLQSLDRRRSGFDISHLRSSNLSHYLAVIHAAENLPDVTQILQAFLCPGRTDSLHVDVVAGQDHLWVKVIARKAQALHLIWAGQCQFGERDILVQAEDYMLCASVHPVNFVDPKVVFAFYNGITLPIASVLRKARVIVLGNEVDVTCEVENTLAKLSLAVSDDDDDDGNADDDDDDDDGVEHEDKNIGEEKRGNPNDRCVYGYPSNSGKGHSQSDSNNDNDNVTKANLTGSFDELDDTGTAVSQKGADSENTGESSNTDTLSICSYTYDNESSMKHSEDIYFKRIQACDDMDIKHHEMDQQSSTPIAHGTHHVSELPIRQPQIRPHSIPEPRDKQTVSASENTDLKQSTNIETMSALSPTIVNSGRPSDRPIALETGERAETILDNIDLTNPLVQISKKTPIVCGKPNSVVVSPRQFDGRKAATSAAGDGESERQYMGEIDFQNRSKTGVISLHDKCEFVAKSASSLITKELLASPLVNYSQLGDCLTESAVSSVDSIVRINLDITALITMVSSVSHGRCRFVFKEKILSMQALEERSDPVLPKLKRFLEGKELFACQTAVDSFRSILDTLGGESECKRAEELFQRLKVVPDNPSFRAQTLPNTGKIKARSKVVFGTGDSLRAVTVTANAGFVRAAENQGVLFSVFLHASRALTEQKEETAECIGTAECLT